MPAHSSADKPSEYSKYSLSSPFTSLILPPRSTTLDNAPLIIRTTIAGDPSVGTITYLRQTHSIYTEEKPELIQIGRFQHEMLKVLEEGKFEYVFAEGLVKTFNLSDPIHVSACGVYHFNLLKQNADLIGGPDDPHQFVAWTRALFSSPPYPELSPDPTTQEHQLITLGILGAHFVYGCMNRSVTLHRTISPELDHHIFQAQQELKAAGKEDGEAFRKLRFIDRETIVMQEIATYLTPSPATSVAVIFGLYHDLTAARDRTWHNAPVLHDIAFIGAFREYLGWKAEARLHRQHVLGDDVQ